MDFKKPHIYIRQILITGKYYIGKHKGGNKYYHGSGKEFKQDIKKYNIDWKKDIITEILEYVDDISKINKREKYWLEYYDAANNPLFYNKTNKPFGPIQQSEEWKLNQSKIKTGKPNIKGRKKRKEGTGINISKGTKGREGGFKDKNHKIESIEKIKNHPTRGQKISEKLTGRDISEWSNKIHTEERNLKISKTRGQGIIQYDLEGNFIKEWISYGEVIRAGFVSIQNAIKKNKPYKGYIWKRKKDV
jgi:hypothetical protein